MAKNRSAVYIGLLIVAAALAGYIVARSLQVGAPQLASGTALPRHGRWRHSPSPTSMALPSTTRASRARPPWCSSASRTAPMSARPRWRCMAQLHRDPALQACAWCSSRSIRIATTRSRCVSYVEAFGGGVHRLCAARMPQLDPLLQSLGAVAVGRSHWQAVTTGGPFRDAVLHRRPGPRSRAVFTPPFSFRRCARTCSRWSPAERRRPQMRQPSSCSSTCCPST